MLKDLLYSSMHNKNHKKNTYVSILLKFAEGESPLHRRRASRALRGRISTSRLTRYICSAGANIQVRGLASKIYYKPQKKNTLLSVLFKFAEGETRTRTLLPAVDFESTASTISPLRPSFSFRKIYV